MSMKLGSSTGSVVNHFYSRGVIGEPKPEVGMGATILCWTDRHAATIVAAGAGKSKLWSSEILVREDFAKVVAGSGHDGSAVYEFRPNPNGKLYAFKKEARTGFWRECRLNPDTGRWNSVKGGMGIRIGSRDEYYDPSF